MFEGFERRRIETADAGINLVIGGGGPPLLLLHGYPQTHACWHLVAPALAGRFTVVVPDLRGYGDSTGPAPGADHTAHGKRAMAADMVRIMAELGFTEFGLVGHDRGGRVAYRLALDHPAAVRRLVTLDIIPTLEMAERTRLPLAMNSYHWFFLAQPRGLPETLIGHDPDFYLDSLLNGWKAPESRFAPEAVAEYKRCFRRPSVIAATCEDYRAGLTCDLDADRADRDAGRRIACPMLALWGQKRMDDRRLSTLEIWTSWAADVVGGPIPCGHFLPEEAPEETASAIADFMAADARAPV